MATPYTVRWLSGPGKTQFYTRTYTPTNPSPPKALLVFMHGFIEHIGRYEHVFPKWQERGIAVFTMDQRGFGRTAVDKEHKSKSSSYGKTSGLDQLADAEWAVKAGRETVGNVPTFLMGHSMGGALTLLFACRNAAPPSPDTVSILSGVIASSPLIRQANPVPKISRWAGGTLSHLAPYFTVPAQVKKEEISHDLEVNERYVNDPLVIQVGSLRCISDMFDRGDELLNSQYKHWPENLPLLLLHGTGDKVTSHHASEEFISKVAAKDKKFSPYEGGYHELHNEPDGVKEKMIEECIAWVEAHIPPAVQTSRL